MGTTRTSTFAITSTTSMLKLDSQGRGSISFTVTNTSGMNLSTRASIKFDDKASSGWFKIDGKDERDIPVDGTQNYSASVQVPLLPSGQTPVEHWLKLRVVDVAAPEERGNESDQIKFTQAAGQVRPFPWLWLIIAAAVVVVAGIGFAVYWIFFHHTAALAADVQLVKPVPSTAFGQIQVNASSPSVTIQVVNQGTKSTPLTISLGGANPGDFSLDTKSCAGLSLPANGGVCDFKVAFAPTSQGSKSATLAFSGDPGATVPKPISLSGTGQGTAVLCANPKRVDLTIIYTTAAATQTSQNVSIGNCGTAPLAISTVNITGDLSHFQIVDDHCSGRTLAPNESCPLTVQFQSSIDGTWGGTIDVFDNASGSGTQFIPLTGTRKPGCYSGKGGYPYYCYRTISVNQ